MSFKRNDAGAAMRRFIEESTPENAAQLQEAMQASSYFLPLDAALSKTLLDTKSAAALQQDAIPVRISLIDGGGRTLEIYTAREELPARADEQGMGAAEVSAPVLFDLLSRLQQEQRLDSVLFNPEGDAMAFPLQGFLDFFMPAQSPEAQEKEHTFDEDTVLSFSNALHSADGVLLRLLRKAGRQNQPVQALWLADVLQPAPMDFLLVAKSDKKDPKLLKRVLSELKGQLKHARVGLVFSDDPLAAYVISFEPVYAKH